MEAALLMLEAAGIIIVLLWAARGHGEEGVLRWRVPADRKAPPRRSRRP